MQAAEAECRLVAEPIEPLSVDDSDDESVRRARSFGMLYSYCLHAVILMAIDTAAPKVVPK